MRNHAKNEAPKKEADPDPDPGIVTPPDWKVTTVRLKLVQHYTRLGERQGGLQGHCQVLLLTLLCYFTAPILG